MPVIQAANQATEAVVTFLNEYHTVPQRPHRAKLEDGRWIVELDI